MGEAKILDAFPRAAGDGYRYPWGEWLDGRIHECVRGEHFPASMDPSDFARIASQASRRAGKRVTTQTNHRADGRVTVCVRAVPR